jgi:hypothetical protein
VVKFSVTRRLVACSPRTRWIRGVERCWRRKAAWTISWRAAAGTAGSR